MGYRFIIESWSLLQTILSVYHLQHSLRSSRLTGPSTFINGYLVPDDGRIMPSRYWIILIFMINNFSTAPFKIYVLPRVVITALTLRLALESEWKKLSNLSTSGKLFCFLDKWRAVPWGPARLWVVWSNVVICCDFSAIPSIHSFLCHSPIFEEIHSYFSWVQTLGAGWLRWMLAAVESSLNGRIGNVGEQEVNLFAQLINPINRRPSSPCRTEPQADINREIAGVDSADESMNMPKTHCRTRRHGIKFIIYSFRQCPMVLFRFEIENFT